MKKKKEGKQRKNRNNENIEMLEKEKKSGAGIVFRRARGFSRNKAL